MHFIPTYSSWLNQVERFFALITDKAIRRGSFSSVNQLVKRIDQFVSHYNENCKPFIWTAIADSILEKLHRLYSRISGTEHQPNLVHWRQFLLWIKKRTLLALLDSTARADASCDHNAPPEVAVVQAWRGAAIPVLTYDKALSALTEHRGNLHKAARALGTTPRAVAQAFTEDRPPERQLPAGIRILK
jgi:hypothetical protein